MSLCRRTHTLRRAAIAVVALYGLLLQGFLAGATAAPSAEIAGILCLQHGGTGGPSGDQPLQAQHGCCKLACPCGLAGPPPLPSTHAALSPWRVATRLTWQVQDGILRDAPAVHGPSARGPPLA